MVPDDYVRIGSITKTFVAAMVLQLDQEGLLDLENPVEQWVPGYFDGEGITLRHLLSHTSGIYNFTEIATFLSIVEQRPVPPDEIAALAAAEPLLFPPGTRWSYSNTNFTLLGMVIEAVTGRPWHVELRARILEPLSLCNTFSAGDEEIPRALARGYDSGGNDVTELLYHPSAGAAGGIVSNTSDLVRWIQALFHGQVIDHAHLRAMITPSLNPNYGLGMEIIEGLYGHTGEFPGYVSVLAYDRRTDVAVAVAFTTDALSPPVFRNTLTRVAIDYCETHDCGRCNGEPIECGPELVRIENGLGAEFAAGAADTFISPQAEDNPFDRFTLQATEDVTLILATSTYTGPTADTAGTTPRGRNVIPAVPEVVRLTAQGDGRHLVELNPAPAPGEWLKLTLTLQGRSAAQATIDIWLAHHPADVNQDGVVDIHDSTAFGEQFRNGGSSLLVDLNGDGAVDVRDATTFGDIWDGRNSASKAWQGSTLPAKPE